MTSKYPDVVAAGQRNAQSDGPFVLDAEIVPVMPSHHPPNAFAANETLDKLVSQAHSEVNIATFQSLSTRKRKNVTETNASNNTVAVKIFLFDLLLLGDEILLQKTLSQRRSAMKVAFATERDVLAFASAVDVQSE